MGERIETPTIIVGVCVAIGLIMIFVLALLNKLVFSEIIILAIPAVFLYTGVDVSMKIKALKKGEIEWEQE